MERRANVMKKTTNDSAKVRSSFNGGLLGLIGINILTSLLSFITLGIAFPWIEVIKKNWLTKHTTYNGRKLIFVGTGGELFNLYFKWILLTIITFGIYSIFVPARLMRWENENTHFADGKKIGESKFTGKTAGLLGTSIICALLLIVTFGIATPSVIAIFTKWERKHTIIDGYKLNFYGHGASLIGRFLLWVLLSVITIGIYFLWVPLKFENWKVSNTEILERFPGVIAVEKIKPKPQEVKPVAQKVKALVKRDVKVEEEPKKSRKTEFKIKNVHTSVLAIICYFLWLASITTSFVLMSQKLNLVTTNVFVLSVVHASIVVLAIIVEFVLLFTKGEKRYKRVRNHIIFSTLYLTFLIAYAVVEFLTPILLEDMWFMYIIIGLLALLIYIILYKYINLYKKATVEKSNDERVYRGLKSYVNLFFMIGLILLMTLFPLIMYTFSYIHTLGNVYQLSVIFFQMSVVYLFATLNIILFFNNVIYKDLYVRLEEEEKALELRKTREVRIEDLLISATKKIHTEPLTEQMKREAFDELEAAIRLGSIVAYAIVGKYYEDKRIYRKAIKYYNKGFEKNCPDSTFFLSRMYKLGAGVKKDLQKSHELLKKAAELGNIKAMRALYISYIEWNNFDRAFKYILMAHEAGDFKSTLILAQSYTVGNLIVKGRVNAGVAESYFLKANELASKKSEKSASYNLVGQLYASRYPQNEDKDILKRSLYFLVNAEKLGSYDAITAIKNSEINQLISACLLDEIYELDMPNKPILKAKRKQK